jgi:hypothetical protein
VIEDLYTQQKETKNNLQKQRAEIVAIETQKEDALKIIKNLQHEIHRLQEQKEEETNNFQQYKTSLTNELSLLKYQLTEGILKPPFLYFPLSSFRFSATYTSIFALKKRKSSCEQKCNRDPSTLPTCLLSNFDNLPKI